MDRYGLSQKQCTRLLFEAPSGGLLRYGNRRRRVWHPAVEATGHRGAGFLDLRRGSTVGNFGGPQQCRPRQVTKNRPPGWAHEQQAARASLLANSEVSWAATCHRRTRAGRQLRSRRPGPRLPRAQVLQPGNGARGPQDRATRFAADLSVPMTNNEADALAADGQAPPQDLQLFPER